MNVSEPQFPVLVTNQDRHSAEFARDWRDAGLCTSRALKNKFYTRLVLVDSRGDGYRVSGVDRVEEKWRSVIDRIRWPRLQYAHFLYSTDSPFRVPFETIRQYALWSLDYEGYGVDWDQFKEDLLATSTIAEIFLILQSIDSITRPATR